MGRRAWGAGFGLFAFVPFCMPNRTKCILLGTGRRAPGGGGCLLFCRGDRKARCGSFGAEQHHAHITETNRMHLVLIGMQNRTFGPYLAAMYRIIISLVPDQVARRPRSGAGGSEGRRRGAAAAAAGCRKAAGCREAGSRCGGRDLGCVGAFWAFLGLGTRAAHPARVPTPLSPAQADIQTEGLTEGPFLRCTSASGFRG
jgi:hypothetical protein